MIATTMHYANHEVSRTGIDDCGSSDVRVCREEWANPAVSDHGRRLAMEWTANL